MPIRPTATLNVVTRAALAAVLALPCAAFAQVQAVTNQPVNLMAGPDDDYPVVTGLGPNQPVEVMGCVSNYEWCDVALDDLRGWVYGGALTYAYEGNDVPLLSYGAVIGLPVVVFSIDSYWDRYYPGRPWYGDRDRWRHAGPPGYPGGPHQPPPHPGQPYPNAGNPYPRPMPQQGQPVYRPNAGPVPHGGQPQPQAQAPGQQQQYGGRPPVQARPQPQPQPQQQPQSRGQQGEGHREPQPYP